MGKKAKADNEDKRTKLVHVEKKVTILNPDGAKKPSGKTQKKEAASSSPAKQGIMKNNTPKMRRKEQKPNSTSRMSLHDDKQTVLDNDVEIEQSKSPGQIAAFTFSLALFEVLHVERNEGLV